MRFLPPKQQRQSTEGRNDRKDTKIHLRPKVFFFVLPVQVEEGKPLKTVEPRFMWKVANEMEEEFVQ